MKTSKTLKLKSADLSGILIKKIIQNSKKI